MTKITNPILPGFNPDPSILRVGDDYYIATSTFEWFPGVQIHHSRDLVNWRLIAHPLSRLSQLDMRGNASSCGVWAPDLSWSDGVFYLIYTNVKAWRIGQPYKDTPNYLVTATDVCGEWSDPVYLNSSGFDPSLFHDDDGRKWLVNMVVDHRPFKNRFGGILLQEYDPIAETMVGPVKNIFGGTSLGLCEGPHLYRLNGWYYLMVAEGGTTYNHAASMARSRNIDGPYEVDPENPFISSKYDARNPLQKCGHGSLVETQNGRWYVAHLCGRPLPNKGRCTLGRETAIQEVRWTDDGWLQAVGGKATPVEVASPGLPECPWPTVPVRQEFDTDSLDLHFATPRVPLVAPYLSLSERSGWVRLRGQHSPVSFFDQTLLARRVQHFTFRAETCLEFDPDNYQQMAGLMCVYDTDNHYYLQVTWDEDHGRVLWLQCMIGRSNLTCPAAPVPLSSNRVWLRAIVSDDRLQHFYSLDGATWEKYGPTCNFATLSDEQYELLGETRFTGAFVGIACHDMSGSLAIADFDYFDYDPDPACAGLLSQSSEY